jgi:TPR repeat protein
MRAILLAAAMLIAAPAVARAPCAPFAWTNEKTAAPSPQDVALLRCWAAYKSPDAGYVLAMLTRFGRGVAADPAAAREMLGQLAKGNDGDDFKGAISGRTRAYVFNGDTQGARLLAVPAYPPAMRELAKMELLGEGGPVNIAAAKELLKAAKDKDREAAVLLNGLIEKGI